MIRLLSAAAIAMLLVGCAVSPEQRERAKSVLPDGCKIHELGEYGPIDMLVVVVCDGRQTVSTNTYERHHKTHKNSVVLGVF